MNFKKSQSGRSMVEMLGVLAIIGVLSVGGIAGYSLSMRRHRANGVVDLLNKYALVVYNDCQQKIINGDISSFDVCHKTSNPTFANAGVGILPTGVNLPTGEEGIHPYFTTNATTGIDTVAFSVGFDDDKLCQAVASITGSTCNNKGVFIQIKQN